MARPSLKELPRDVIVEPGSTVASVKLIGAACEVEAAHRMIETTEGGLLGYLESIRTGLAHFPKTYEKPLGRKCNKSESTDPVELFESMKVRRD
jgi:hypothetical protein